MLIDLDNIFGHHSGVVHGQVTNIFFICFSLSLIIARVYGCFLVCLVEVWLPLSYQALNLHLTGQVLADLWYALVGIWSAHIFLPIHPERVDSIDDKPAAVRVQPMRFAILRSVSLHHPASASTHRNPAASHAVVLDQSLVTHPVTMSRGQGNQLSFFDIGNLYRYVCIFTKTSIMLLTTNRATMLSSSRMPTSTIRSNTDFAKLSASGTLPKTLSGLFFGVRANLLKTAIILTDTADEYTSPCHCSNRCHPCKLLQSVYFFGM